MQPFAPGQVWAYNTRPGEETSRIIVCRVEADPVLGQVVHIHVNGLRLRSRHGPEGFTNQIGHMPYSEDALRKSVTTLESTGIPLPAFQDGYQQWRSAFEAGRAGVWSLPVAEAITGMEAILNP